jgi:hypothetical protein
MNRFIRILRAGMPVLVLAVGANVASAGDTPAPAAKPKTAAASSSRGLSSPVATKPVVLVHKSPTCSCCHKWVDHLRAAGFTVEVHDTVDLQAVKERVGVPPAKGSCHTAEVAGYFIEGHVPAEDVRRLLAERPQARGLTVPGMPIGSPGMEVPSMQAQAYSVLLVKRDGSTVEYAAHGGGAAAGGAHDHAHEHGH